jgi:hypothetical protein
LPLPSRGAIFQRMETDTKYQVLLRRELIRAQARLKRAERERDALLEENRRMRQLLRDHGIAPPRSVKNK